MVTTLKKINRFLSKAVYEAVFRGLDEPGELVGWNKGDVARASAPDDDRFLFGYNLIQNAGQVFPEPRIRRLNRHGTPCSYWTVFLYASVSGSQAGQDGEPSGSQKPLFLILRRRHFNGLATFRQSGFQDACASIVPNRSGKP
jgi:hypothetical protein